ncbi:MAG TPA: hypothetical protein VFR99_04165 [Marmoricola sp.]|nr:hypothetical protein [Marmoricola sp.]
MTRLLIRLVLLTYPRDYRRAYGDEIAEVALRSRRTLPLRELAALVGGGARQRFRQARARPARAVTIVLPRPFLMATNALIVLLSGVGTGVLLARLLFRQKLGTLCAPYCVDVYVTAATPQQWALCLVLGVAVCAAAFRLLAAARRRLGIFP